MSLNPSTNNPVSWPSTDHTLIPCDVYLDERIFEQEQELIFKGPVWHLSGLLDDIPEPGDFTCTYVGTTPVVLHRAHDNSINAYVNRCAHRGARVIRELRGNNKFPICPYHNWRYDGTGKLLGVTMEQGFRSKGGYPDNFSKDCHGLQTLRVEILKDVIFATFNEHAPPLREYLGRAIVERIETICRRPLRIVGYQRQTVQCNWKLFVENNRDTYHGPQLHTFVRQFGIAMPVNRVSVDIHNAHALLSSWLPAADPEDPAEFPMQKGEYELEDPSIAEGFRVLGDLQLSVISIFPGSLFTCIRNSWSCRRIIPTSPGTTDIEYTWFGYDNESDFERECRIKQSNLLGPAGYIALEDAEVLAMTQNAISRGETSYIEFGGAGIEATSDHFNSEATIRAFWKGYCEAMQIPA